MKGAIAFVLAVVVIASVLFLGVFQPSAPSTGLTIENGPTQEDFDLIEQELNNLEGLTEKDFEALLLLEQ